MRALAVALAALALAVPSVSGGTGAHAKVAFLHGTRLVVLDLVTRTHRTALAQAGSGPVRWSGDGRLVSSGGRVAGGPSFPAPDLTWAPTGERLAYVSHKGGVVEWTPGGGSRVVLPDRWGATGLAWSRDGRLAIGRGAYTLPVRVREIWTWDGKALRRVLVVKAGVGEPVPVGWHDGRVLWWAYPDSASIAADGVALYENRARIGETLMYPDYVAPCGAGVAIADGGDRYATHGKRIVLDGRNVSRDPARSWVSPSCSTDGSILVAAAGRNWEEDRFGHEHRAIWQLLPTRRQLTHPPPGWTDERPQVLADTSVLFVRTRQTSRALNGHWFVTEHARLEVLRRGKLTAPDNVTYTASEVTALGNWNYYGHYGWPWLIAVAP